MMRKRLLSLLLAASLLLCCAAALADAEADPVLYTVNGTQITLSQAQEVYDYYIDLYGSYGYDMDDAENQEVIRAFATQELVWQTLIEGYAAENGLDVFTDEEEAELNAENDAQWDAAIADYISYETGLTDLADVPEEELATLRANAIAYYNAEGFTMESTLRNIRQARLNERVKAAVLTEEDVNVTEADITAHHAELAEQDRAMLYDEEGNYGMSPSEVYSMYSAFGYQLNYIPEGFRMVKYILLTPDADALETYRNLAAQLEEQAEATETGEDAEDGDKVTWEQVEAARLAVIATVQDRLDEIAAALQEGVTFDELIARYGQDPAMNEEPAVSEGFMISADSYDFDAAFVQAAFTTENPGEITDPVVSGDGVHLILYVDDAPAGPVPMTDEMRAAYYEDLVADAEENAFTAVVNHWIAEAEIVYTEAGEAWRMDILDEAPEAEAEAEAEAAPAESAD